MLKIDPLTPSIGATVSGLAYSKPLSEAVYLELYQALLQHLVIFVEGVEIEACTSRS